MRSALDRLYRTSEVLGALFLVAVWAIVLLQVGFNLLDLVADWTLGAPIGLVVPSYGELAGFFLAATTFLALASTWRAGAHVRVNLVLRTAPVAVARWIDLWCIAAAALIGGYFAYHASGLCWQSFVHGDVSSGLVPVPLWLPQFAMSLGLTILVVALLDRAAGLISDQDAWASPPGPSAISGVHAQLPSA
jgi:TRAP-type C4-dicarboxylate transport system permease small subunit